MSIPSQIPTKVHDLFIAAEKVQKNAYAPYSKFKVGAAIRLTNGKIFASGNIENVVNGASVCAERGALQAIMSEYGKIEMTEVLVLTEGSPPAFCCGVCRQALSEFVPKGKDLDITTVNHKGEVLTSTLRALLPHAYTPDYVEH